MLDSEGWGWGGDGESSHLLQGCREGSLLQKPAPARSALPFPSLPSPGAHDSRRQLPDLLLLHRHLLLQHRRRGPQGLPRDVRDALGPRRGELGGCSCPREARSGVAWLALFKRGSRVVFLGWHSQVWKDPVSMWHSTSPRSGRPGGPCATLTAGWSRCPSGITSGTGLTSSSAPETTARGIRRSGRTTSTWTRVSPLPAPACWLPAASPRLVSLEMAAFSPCFDP